LGPLTANNEGNFLEGGFGAGMSRPYSEETARAVDHATRRIVDECYAKAVDLLTRERERLEALAEALLREESLNEEEMREVTGLPARRSAQETVAMVR
jgi:cell division protease FtsH